MATLLPYLALLVATTAFGESRVHHSTHYDYRVVTWVDALPYP